MEALPLWSLSLLLGGLLFLLFVLKWWRSGGTEVEEAGPRGKGRDREAEPSGPGDDVNGEASARASFMKKQKQLRLRKDKPQQHTFAHPLLAAALKGHSGSVTCLDFSSNGKYLASCSDDRTVRIWSTKDFLEREHRYMRANVELDHATFVRFYPDAR
ncbi:transducin beta-like protein 2 [Sceloporus undulatus]|uniref:transducin beta-like protein 2 n=1 Tax=Sceloporus undulatus TaxID=8520 RepID=UPI001C4C2BF6|nr:transducin beta-like protein 2 [Sceloporus undulatus]